VQIAEEVGKLPLSWFGLMSLAELWEVRRILGRNIHKESTWSLTAICISVCLTWIFGGDMEATLEFPTEKPGKQKKSRGKAFFDFATNHLAQSSLHASLKEPVSHAFDPSFN